MQPETKNHPLNIAVYASVAAAAFYANRGTWSAITAGVSIGFLVGFFAYLIIEFVPELIRRIEDQTKEPTEPAVVKVEENKGNATVSTEPSTPPRPPQTPVREVRQAEYVTQAEPMQTAVNYPQWIRDFDLPPHIKRQWVVELWQARDRGQLRKVSANKVSLVTSADRTKYDADGNSEAALLVSWLIDNYFVTSSGKNNQYEWNGKGRVHFPSPAKELAHQ